MVATELQRHLHNDLGSRLKPNHPNEVEINKVATKSDQVWACAGSLSAHPSGEFHHRALCLAFGSEKYFGRIHFLVFRFLFVSEFILNSPLDDGMYSQVVEFHPAWVM